MTESYAIPHISPVPVQVQLYEDFAKSRAKVDVDDVISTSSAPEEEEKPKLKATGHVFQVWCYELSENIEKLLSDRACVWWWFWSFQALQYLRKLCNHPALVLTPQHPEYKHITEQLSSQHTSLRDIQHAPKLSALKQVCLEFIFK